MSSKRLWNKVPKEADEFSMLTVKLNTMIGECHIRKRQKHTILILTMKLGDASLQRQVTEAFKYKEILQEYLLH